MWSGTERTLGEINLPRIKHGVPKMQTESEKTSTINPVRDHFMLWELFP
jgi:hypothetical protein